MYYLIKFEYKAVFELFSITSANLCKPINGIINYSISICSFESEKCGQEQKKNKHLNISRMKRAFSMNFISFYFIVFEELSFGEKIKNW